MDASEAKNRLEREKKRSGGGTHAPGGLKLNVEQLWIRTCNGKNIGGERIRGSRLFLKSVSFRTFSIVICALNYHD